MKRLRILQHERNTDNIRIGGAFRQNTRNFDDIAQEVIQGYAKRGADDVSKYNCEVSIVDADTLERLHTIYSDEK